MNPVYPELNSYELNRKKNQSNSVTTNTEQMLTQLQLFLPLHWLGSFLCLQKFHIDLP